MAQTISALPNRRGLETRTATSIVSLGHAVLDQLARFRVELERRRLVLDQVLEFPPEGVDRHAGGGRELGELVRVVEVVATQPDHISPRDRIARRRDVDEPYLRPAGPRVEQGGKGNRHEMT